MQGLLPSPARFLRRTMTVAVRAYARGVGPACALQMLFQPIVDQAQQVGAIRSRARHDMHRRRTRMSIREHFDREQIAGRSRRPSRFQSCPLESELVPNSSHAVGMMIDRGLDFSLQHVAPPISIGSIFVEQLLSQVVILRIPKESESSSGASVPSMFRSGTQRVDHTARTADFRPCSRRSGLRRLKSRFGTRNTQHAVAQTARWLA